MATVHAGLSRHVGGIGHPALFQTSLVGTKLLIEAYVAEMDRCLHAIAAGAPPAASGKGITLATRIEYFASLRKVFGRSALLLSGGATLGMYHLGVVKCLHENGMLPRIFSGSSAGSIVAALVCTRTDEELPRVFDPANINMEAIERRGEGTLKRRLSRLRRTGFFFDISVLQECIRANSGDVTFLEAYNRTRRVLNVTVSSASNYELPRLLNYLTAPDVLIWSAVSASSAIPGLYAPVPLMAKTRNGTIAPWNPAGTQWVDGSVEGDLPMARLAEQFNVNHCIVSQVNPHVVPFLHARARLGSSGGVGGGGGGRRTLLGRLAYLATSEVQHRLGQLFELGIFPRSLSRLVFVTRSLLAQSYTGDITIVPNIGYDEYLKLMTNPVAPEVRVNIRKAEHATWESTSSTVQFFYMSVCL
jgi:predicted acylesterase/phospholipase RssA